MSDSSLQRDIMRLFNRGPVRLFRNNVGKGWIGKVTRPRPDIVVIHHPRPLHAGLFKGFPDRIGWRTIVITPDMVGQRVAVFAGIEAKGEGDKPKPHQQNAIDQINKAGGYAGAAWTVEDAKEILRL